jgi:hypothetical protein
MSNQLVTSSVLACSIALAVGGCATGADPKIRAELSAKLASAQAPIQACYQKSLTTNRKLRGMYVVQLAANAETGQFGEITLRRDEPADPVLRFCVISELAKLRLDQPPGKRIEVDSIPIKFEWTSP